MVDSPNDIPGSFGKVFPNPWDDKVSRQAPITMQDALYWCEYIALSNQTLASALKKLVSFFVTEVEVTGTGRSEQKKIKDYLYNTLHIENVLNSIGLDYLVYGNCFVTIWQPVYKTITCPNCNFHANFYEYALNPDTEFNFSDFELSFKCLHCKYKGKWPYKERRHPGEDKLSVIRWNVHDMQVAIDMFSSTRKEYILKIPGEYKSVIQTGSPLAIDGAPTSFLEAVKNNTEYRLDPDKVVHLYEPALAGLRTYGWGLSPIISNFRQTYYIETLRRANQEICMDYIIPLRIISPEPRSSAPEYGDPNLTSGFSNTNASIAGIIKNWRKDPTGWYSCPFPIRYQLLGGEGQRIIPAPVLQQAQVDLVSSMGMPVEFYQGNLTVQAMPVALRLLEGTWSSLSRLLNTFLRHLASDLSRLFRWDNFELKLQRPSYADDVNKQMAKLQLAISGAISQTTGLQSIGLSQEEEMERKIEETEFQAEKEKEMQERMESKSLTEMLSTPMEQLLGGMPGGAPIGAPMGVPMGVPPGGAPMGPAPGGAPPPMSASGPPPNDPISALLASIPDTKTGQVALDDLLNIAQQIAQQLMGMHPSMRVSALRKIQQKNEVVHALVGRKLEELYNQAALQGKIMAQQQAAQQAPPPM